MLFHGVCSSLGFVSKHDNIDNIVEKISGFKSFQNFSCTYPRNLCFAVFVHFWGYLGGDDFSQRIIEI